MRRSRQDGGTRRTAAALAAGVVVAAVAAGTGPARAATAEPAATGGTACTSGAVVVQGLPGRLDQVRAAVEAAGGTRVRDLGVIDGVSADVPADAACALAEHPAVRAVTADVSGRLMAYDPALGYDPTADTGSLHDIAAIVGAHSAYKAGITGKGVDVALIDTGVAPVPGLTSGNVVNGPDLSFDSQHADVRYKDTYGHGTHMASIIAGRDTVLAPGDYAKPATFHGIAPDARIVNIKVGASDGAVDVSQVIAAIDWVTQHAKDPGLNIRVLNLSFGTDATQDSRVDPLAYAAQAAWRKGILVVVAGGNDGTSNVDLANPALDGNLLAVGASDPMGTLQVLDDTVPAFANRGTSKRHVDLVAPGVHVLGLRVPNGVVDQAYPSARVGDRFFRGSGTSQATAVVSGTAALLLQKYPDLTPQQTKMILGYSAQWMAKGTTNTAGAGIVNVGKALSVAASPLVRSLASTTTASFGTGTGSLEAARGSVHVTMDGVTLTGERDIFGRPFTASAWAPTALAGTAWTADGSWNGTGWTGAGFDGTGSWAGRSWVAASWSGGQWSGRSWVGRSWVANGWDGRSWVADAWQGRSWVGRSWSEASWS